MWSWYENKTLTVRDPDQGSWIAAEEGPWSNICRVNPDFPFPDPQARALSPKKNNLIDVPVPLRGLRCPTHPSELGDASLLFSRGC
jgi:hypothetical protein